MEPTDFPLDRVRSRDTGVVGGLPTRAVPG